MTRIWQVGVTIPGMTLTRFFRSDSRPTEQQVFAAMSMSGREEGPLEAALSTDERYRRIYPVMTKCEPIVIEDLGK